MKFDTKHRDDHYLVDDQLKQLHERMQRSWWNKKAKWFFVLLIVSVVLSYVSILKLKEGGDVTFLSMLVICLVGYILEPEYGLLAAFLFGVIKYVIDYVIPGSFQTVLSSVIHEPGYLSDLFGQIHSVGYRAYRAGRVLSGQVDEIQVIGDLFDYLFGYTLLGLFGFFEAVTKKTAGGYDQRFTIRSAFLIVVILRFIESVINYAVFYSEPVVWWMFWGEALTYSFMYVIIEGVLSLAVLYLPPVVDTIQYFRTVAGHEYNEKLYQEYH